ncbi:MAG: NblA/ycf18 family protein [Leptolyngbyaceae cyanobacterium MO_188.B28]|nr:NblA/ycf18 family protein [Leptolyngbyaceae cyanobacterium MO_188.B28]
MDQEIEFTLEQELSLRSFAEQVQQMSREQAQEYIIVQHRLMMVQKKMYQELFRRERNLGLDDASL